MARPPGFVTEMQRLLDKWLSFRTERNTYKVAFIDRRDKLVGLDMTRQCIACWGHHNESYEGRTRLYANQMGECIVDCKYNTNEPLKIGRINQSAFDQTEIKEQIICGRLSHEDARVSTSAQCLVCQGSLVSALSHVRTGHLSASPLEWVPEIWSIYDFDDETQDGNANEVVDVLICQSLGRSKGCGTYHIVRFEFNYDENLHCLKMRQCDFGTSDVCAMRNLIKDEFGCEGTNLPGPIKELVLDFLCSRDGGFVLADSPINGSDATIIEVTEDYCGCPHNCELGNIRQIRELDRFSQGSLLDPYGNIVLSPSFAGSQTRSRVVDLFRHFNFMATMGLTYTVDDHEGEFIIGTVNIKEGQGHLLFQEEESGA